MANQLIHPFTDLILNVKHLRFIQEADVDT